MNLFAYTEITKDPAVWESLYNWEERNTFEIFFTIIIVLGFLFVF